MLRRRDFLRLAAVGGSVALTDGRFSSWLPRARASQPAPFSVPLPIPAVLQPLVSDASGDYYELTVKSALAQLRDGPQTEIWGFDGSWPGPTIQATRGRPTHVRATNLMSRDVNIYNHGYKVLPESDGHMHDVIRQGESRTYTYPKDQQASTYWYHDHTMTSAETIYRALAGFYLIDDPAEHCLSLPSSRYDIPLMLQDRTLDAENGFSYVLDEQTVEAGVFGDTLFVNGVASPYLEVANRKYRFRILAATNRRSFNLRLSDGGPLVIVGSDGGPLEAPVTQTDFAINVGERFDVVIDFSRYPVGSSVILHNDRANEQGVAVSHPLPDVMRFDIVRDERDPSDVPPMLADLSKIESGQLELDLSSFSLSEVLESSLTMVRERATNHRIVLQLEADPDIGEVEADERKVKQILFNLLSNAVKFTPDGGRIAVSATRVDGQVQVAVADTGVGIAPEDQERIFEEFQQARQGPHLAKVEGTGLGLTFTRRFVELHAGRIGVESEPEWGSTFTVTLPIEPTAPAGAAGPHVSRELDDTKSTL